MDKVNQLLSLQEDRFEQIKKSQVNYGKAPKTRITLSYLDTRLENLEQVWTSFKATHAQIISNVTKEQKSALNYFANDVYEECEEVYISYKADLKTKIKEFTPSIPEVTATKNKIVSTEVKLPTISIPTFSGKYTEWPSFHDLFMSLIHNNDNIDEVQKLHYLKSSLSGEAEQLLRSIPVTSQNYKQAWETLKNRYNNKRYIANCVFKKLFGIKPMSSESASHMKLLLDTTIECLSSLKNLGLPTSTWDAIIIYMTVAKLDSESHKQWEFHIASDERDFPRFESLKQFLESRFRTLEMIEHTNKPAKPKTFHAALDSTSTSTCTFCKEDHYIHQCKVFAKKPYEEKLEFVKNNYLCFNCLAPNHIAKLCVRDTICKICKRKHHSLLHQEQKETVEEEDHTDQGKEKIASHFVNQPCQILLTTALVDVASRNGPTHIYRALIDQGSQASFVTEDLVQTTGLKRVKINGVVSGLSEGNKLYTKYMVELIIQSRTDPSFTVPVKAYVLRSITNYLPSQTILTDDWPELETVTLADPTYNKPSKIDLLLGADVYSKIIDAGLMKSTFGIIAQHTHLGWILSGDSSVGPERKNSVISMHVCSCENDLLKKFWEVENEVLNSERKLTKEEEMCETIYKNTTLRTETGRYKVNLPFKENVSPATECGRTKEIATSRFLQLEKKFKGDSKLKTEYAKVIKEYIDLNHMSLAADDKEDVIYLPHHAVIRNDKDTTKLRVVYDASCKGSRGVSLNDTLLTGAVLQKDLHTLIMEWRLHKIAIVGDIVKMYRQVLVSDEHTEYQRILWRDSDDEKLQSYKLLTVTFGTAPAPFLAVRTLHQVAEDEEDKYPLGAEIVKNSFYMDDLMTGSNNVDNAIDICNEVKNVLASAGFEMQKWSSNSDEFLEKIKQTRKEDQKKSLEIKFDKIIKILGLFWDREDDKFKFVVTLPELRKIITKRNVLSDIARLFDPFGWLAPIIMKAKVFMQKLWLCTQEWDEELSEDLKEEWIEFRSQLTTLNEIELDRWIHTYPDDNSVELHGFADASAYAYAAVLYLKVVRDGEVFVTIIESKTKVAPLKQISVARLELCAAVLLAKILSETANTLKIQRDKLFAYTDSTIVMSWIQAQPTKWKTFVANRVADIQTRIDNDRWNHVTSEENPADIASRGLKPCELKNNMFWWKGPHWLHKKDFTLEKKRVPETNLEERKLTTEIFHCNVEDEIIERFSCLTKLIRVLTYCRRFLNLKIKKELRKELPKYLTNKEMKCTLENCIRMSQERKFKDEIESLRQKKNIKKQSKLVSLSPYLDDEGLLRVGGRIQAAKLPQEVKHPIIISGECHLAELLVREAHMKLLHGGIAMMINYLRSKYWIINLKSIVKKCYRRCTTCIRFKAATLQPQMGELPSVRVNPGKPFESTGVDFAGPIQMRVSKGRGQKSFKGYICLFVCMKTKALHLEAVSDLTAQGFLAAFRRFVSRRGRCSDLFSDNGLNFVGAARELTRMFGQSMDAVLPEIAALLENDGTNWHFIPPRAPNFGGLWETGVKSVKGHLLKTIGDSTLTYEEMSTLLCQIESCLNSRPICQINDNPDDLSPLTPAHFLVGEPTQIIPERQDSNEIYSPLNRWRMIQKMMKHFWDRWSREYLHTMQQRRKWQVKTNPPKIGDVVIIKDTDVPPSKWLLARIVELHFGKDGCTRVATLKCKGSTIKRPLSKLIILPIDDRRSINE